MLALYLVGKLVLCVHIILNSMYLCACSFGLQGFIQLRELKVDQVTDIAQTQPLCPSRTVA